MVKNYLKKRDFSETSWGIDLGTKPLNMLQSVCLPHAPRRLRMIFATGERNLRERLKLGIVTVDQRKHPGLTGWWFQPTPLKNYEFVSWDDDLSPIFGKSESSCSKPPTSISH